MYICKCLRQGRAVSIPKFGLFTYSFRDVNLDGTTNEFDRDKEEREPVFIISKDFAKGLDLKSGVHRQGGIIRPLVLSSTSGKIQQTLCSFQEIASISNLEKDNVKYSVERIIRRLEDQIRNGEDPIYMFIPSLGLFMYKKGLVCVKFQEFIKKDIKGLLKLSVDKRKKKNHSDLTSEKLKALTQNFKNASQVIDQEEYIQPVATIQEDAQEYLKSNLQMDSNQIIEEGRTPHNQEELSNKLQQILASTTNDTIKLATTTRDAYSKQTNRTITVIQSEEEILFQKLQYILRNKSLKPYDLLSKMLGYIYGVNSTDRKTLTEEQFKKALQKYDIELENEEEYSLLFSYIDSKKDKQIDLEEWQSAFKKKENQSLEYLKDILMRNNIVIDDFFKTMGLNRDQNQVTLQEFKNGLKKINISKYHSDLAAAEIFEDKQSIPPQQIIDKLTADRKNLKNLTHYSSTKGNGADMDDSDTSLLLQIYRKIKQELINKYPEEKGDRHDKYLIQEFEKLDQQSQGSLDIANFKTCLMKANLNLAFNEVVRIARYIEKNEKGQIDYCKFSKKVNQIHENPIKMQQVNNSLRMNDEIESLPYLVEMIKKYMKTNKMNSEDLITHLIENKDNRKAYNIQDKKKLRIPVFASIIARKIPSTLQESVIQQNCELIDIDRDGYIDKFDLETFLNRYYYIEDQISKKPTLTTQVFSKSHSGNFFSQGKHTTVNSTLQNKQYLSNQLTNITKSQLTNQPTRLYPTDTLPLEKLEVILRDLKQNANLRRLSYYEIFKILDTNNDGFISFNEFEEKIDSFIKLSSNAKEGLFAYFDHLKIGMFDFPRFASILSRITLKHNDDKQVDNWNWQHDIIRQIKDWKEQNGFSEEEAFRLIDCDFDGFISIQDLKKFLTRDFKIREDQLDHTKLDRLFKLFDQYKKGYIQKHDFSKIFTNQFDDLLANGLKQGQETLNESFFKTPYDQLSKSVTNLKVFTQTPKSVPALHVKDLSKTLTILKPKKQLYNGNTLKVEDWMINCCQQIALVVSSTYKDLIDAFENISNHSNKIEYHKLNEWILKANALFGFNLTESLLQRLFAYMDPHKKGYITQDDWIECLKIYVESKDIPLSDLSDLIFFSFKTTEEAFKFFLFGSKFEKALESKSLYGAGEISLHKFKFALNNLYKQVYSDRIIERLWINIHQYLKIPVEQQLNLDHFAKLFPRIGSQTSRYNRSGSRTKLRVANIDELRFSDQFKSSSLSTNNLVSYNNFTLHDDIINKFKNLILSKGKDIQSVFRQYDKNDCGYISNTEFKNILMRLNIGLNGRDMDYILIFADPSSPAQINWKNFMKKLQFSSSQQNLINRSKKRLTHLKECLYSYLISPKDAFREFDEEKKGYMTLEDFRYFLVKIAKLDRSDIPSFAISKDMFDQIDIKKDGLIDLDEWLQSFMNFGGTEEHELITKEKEKDKWIFNQFHKKKLDILTSASELKKKYKLQKERNGESNTFQPSQNKYSRSSSTHNLNSGGGTQNVVDVIKNSSSIPLAWEKSQDYDKAISLIARNRKYLLQKFENLYQLEHGKGKKDGLDKYLCTESVKQVLWEFLTSHSINSSESNLSVLYNFAAQKNGQINYNFMIDVFKNRLDQQNNPPKNS